MVFSRETLPTRNEQPVTDKEARPPRNLGNNDITKLLDDLDNQTEAIKSGQEIGEELLGEKNDTRFKEKLERKNNSLFVKGMLISKLVFKTFFKHFPNMKCFACH